MPPIFKAIIFAREAITMPFPPIFTPYVIADQLLENFETRIAAGTLLKIWEVAIEER